MLTILEIAMFKMGCLAKTILLSILMIKLASL